jgi:hypothetical protein
MSTASCPHTHILYERYAPERFALDVDMTGWGQLLRTCQQPLDNSLDIKPRTTRYDISNELETVTFLKSLDIHLRMFLT